MDASPTPRTLRNHYCSNCLRTQTFLECGPHLICPRCARMLRKAPPPPERAGRAA